MATALTPNREYPSLPSLGQVARPGNSLVLGGDNMQRSSGYCINPHLLDQQPSEDSSFLTLSVNMSAEEIASNVLR